MSTIILFLPDQYFHVVVALVVVVEAVDGDLEGVEESMIDDQVVV